MSKHLRSRAITALAVLGLLLVSAVVAFSADTRVRPGLAPTIVDSRGKALGSVVDLTGNQMIVIIRVGGVPVALSTNGEFLFGAGMTADAPLIFESNDCSGDPYDGLGGLGGSTSNEALQTILKNGLKLYRPIGEPREFSFHSVLNTDASCVPLDATQNAAPVQLLADLTDEYVAPFRLRFGD